MGSKNNWNADAMKGTLISDMENEVMEGIRKTNTEQQVGEHQTSASPPTPLQKARGVVSPQTSAIEHQTSEKEPTKGVQTYITMEDYSRLMAIKLKRDADAKQKLQPRITIAKLAEEAIELWLDVQEGKAKVNKVI